MHSSMACAGGSPRVATKLCLWSMSNRPLGTNRPCNAPMRLCPTKTRRVHNSRRPRTLVLPRLYCHSGSQNFPARRAELQGTATTPKLRLCNYQLHAMSLSWLFDALKLPGLRDALRRCSQQPPHRNTVHQELPDPGAQRHVVHELALMILASSRIWSTRC